MNETKKSVNTTETEKEYIPDFVRVGEFSIQDRITGKIFDDLRQNNQTRAACRMYRIVTHPTGPAGKTNTVYLFFQRISEYLIKCVHPDIKPDPFYTLGGFYKVLDGFYKVKKISALLRSFPENGTMPDELAKHIVEFFTSDNIINIAIEKCRITGNTHEKYKENFVKINKEKQVTANENNDLFNEQDKTGNDKDNSLYSVLFEGVDLSDFNKRLCRYNFICNILHLYTYNKVQFQHIMSEEEKAINNHSLEKLKKTIEHYVENETSLDRIAEILKFITDK